MKLKISAKEHDFLESLTAKVWDSKGITDLLNKLVAPIIYRHLKKYEDDSGHISIIEMNVAMVEINTMFEPYISAAKPIVIDVEVTRTARKSMIIYGFEIIHDPIGPRPYQLQTLMKHRAQAI